MNETASLTKAQTRTAFLYSIRKMRYYLKEKGFCPNGLKLNDITRVYAQMKYSETVLDHKIWILGKYINGDFVGMKTGHTNKAKVHNDTGVPSIQKMNYHDFIKSPYWRYVRKIILTRDGNKCTKCNAPHKLEAHHLTYKNHFNEHNHLEDLITLCKSCHEKEHEVLNKKKEELYSQYNIPIVPIAKPKKKYKKR